MCGPGSLIFQLNSVQAFSDCSRQNNYQRHVKVAGRVMEWDYQPLLLWRRKEAIGNRLSPVSKRTQVKDHGLPLTRLRYLFFFSCQGPMDIYHNIHSWHKVINFRISLIQMYSISSFTCDCLGSIRPIDFVGFTGLVCALDILYLCKIIL